MPQDKLTGSQRQRMFALMAEAREISNPELDAACGLRITGEDRRRLVAEKLVTSKKKGQAYSHALTDRGLGWCRDEFAAGPGERPSPWERVFYRVTAGLGRYLDTGQFVVDHVFTPEPLEPSEPLESSESPEGPEAAETPEAAAPSPVSVLDRVRRAYAALAPEPEGWVSLTDLRRRLDGVPKHEVDQVLRELDGRGVTLIPEANQKTLTAEDRKAAVRIGAEDNHFLSMAE